MRNWKPKLCSGCGETREFPPSNGVCYDCHGLLRRAIQQRDEDERRLAAGEEKLYRWTYAFLGGHGLSFSERATDVINRLATALSRAPADAPGHWDGEYLDLGSPSGKSRVANFRRLMRPDHAKLLEDLVARTRRELEANYFEGKRDGQNILKGLMDGSLGQLQAEAREKRGP